MKNTGFYPFLFPAECVKIELITEFAPVKTIDFQKHFEYNSKIRKESI